MNIMRVSMLGFMGFYSFILLTFLIYSIRDSLTGGSMELDIPLVLNSMIWSFGFMAMSIFIAFSPYADKMAALFFPTRKQSLREEEKLNPAMEQVKQAYQNKYNKELNMKVFVLDEPQINGMALGRETVAVSTGLLKVGTEDEIAGVLAHEAGHLHNHDGVLSMALLVASLPTVLLNHVFKLLFMTGARIKFIPTSVQDFSWVIGFVIMVTFVFLFIYFLVFWVFSFPILWLVNYFTGFTQYPIEYKADETAYELGYGPALIELFERIEDEDIRNTTGFLSKYLYSHPPTALRIDKIERLLI